MQTSINRSRYEARLASAHRALYAASEIAELLGDDGAVEDISAAMQHLSVMLADSLKGKKRPRQQTQFSLDTRA